MRGPSDDKWHVPSLACSAFMTARQAVFEGLAATLAVMGLVLMAVQLWSSEPI